MNVFALPAELPAEELVEPLLTGATRIERIVSNGQTSGWYDQAEDEWVCVLAGEGELEYAGGRRQRLRAGDTAWLPAHLRHRVSYTSAPCIWLCVFRPAEPQSASGR
ncbi:MAG TPA: cupin domain-containing protein [Candidatus Butyricicoccus stercorigallinarum]|nr:cupin domain-containing protein [Candidatus Butyricicoccus stercorigallinarum]